MIVSGYIPPKSVATVNARRSTGADVGVGGRGDEVGVGNGDEVKVAIGDGDKVLLIPIGVTVSSTGWQASRRNIKMNDHLIKFAIGFFLSSLFIRSKPPFEL
jgi:hypothetical protein